MIPFVRRDEHILTVRFERPQIKAMAEAGMVGPHLRFHDVGTASSKGRRGGSFLINVTGDGVYGSAIVFQCILNQDVDGAPNCYARFNPASPNAKNGGLDFLRNGTSDENATFQAGGNAWEWHGVVALTPKDAKDAGVRIDEDKDQRLRDRLGRFPVLQPGDQFYVSTTALPANANLPRTSQGRYWDATAVSYGALTPPLRRLGVNLGDFGLAIRNDNGTSEAFFYADAGAQEKVGEVSTHLFQKLFPRNDQEDHPVTFIVFPGSGPQPFQQSAQKREIQSRLFWLRQADNISELIDVMAATQGFGDFRVAGATLVNSPARQNILSALQKHGDWHFFHDMAYNIDPPDKAQRWAEWMEQHS